MSSKEIKEIAIIGPGLIGGAIGLALQETHSVRFWGRSEEKLIPVREAGFSASIHLESVIRKADLIILCVPVTVMKSLIPKLKASGLDKDQLITDVGSVKGNVVDSLQPHLAEEGFSFIGSHPMAGSENAGFSSAHAQLLKKASCIITPDAFTQESQLQALELFWQAVGMKTFILNPEDHDQIISRVSHMPHILAAVCAHVALCDPNNGQYAGNGLKDTSRVASGNASLWEGILSENSNAILPHLDEAILRLKQYREALATEPGSNLKHLLAEDKNARDSFYFK